MGHITGHFDRDTTGMHPQRGWLVVVMAPRKCSGPLPPPAAPPPAPLPSRLGLSSLLPQRPLASYALPVGILITEISFEQYFLSCTGTQTQYFPGQYFLPTLFCRHLQTAKSDHIYSTELLFLSTTNPRQRPPPV